MTLPVRLLVLGFLSSNVGKTQILKVPAVCTGFTCDNNGTVLTAGGECSCACPKSHTGIWCQTELGESNWPEGPYATPMPIYGCTEEEGMGWKTGYINMTFKDKAIDSTMAARLLLLGPYDDHVIQMNFCYKTSGMESAVQWPSGHYSIYRAGGRCPEEFEQQELRLEVPRLLHVNTDGYVPDLIFTEEKGSTILRMSVCDRLRTPTDKRIVPALDFPFILLTGSRVTDDMATCSTFADIDALQEVLDIKPVTVTRFVTNDTTGMAEDGLNYCLYRLNIKQPGESLEKDMGPIDLNLVTFERSLASGEYEQLYKDYPVSCCGTEREIFFEVEGVLESAKVPLGVFVQSNEIPWLLIDMEQTIHVEFVQLIGISTSKMPSRSSTKGGKDWNWTYADFPATGVSHLRWAFLNNGALVCDGNAYGDGLYANTFRIGCSRTVAGRYVSIYGKGFDIAPEKTASFYMGLMNVQISGTGRGCGKDLGLRDFGIEDFQISASSYKKEHLPSRVRPDLSGWCAANSDSDPYLQVDLLVATIVEGIKIFNWETTTAVHRRNVYGVKTFPTGAKSFSLQYGFSAERLKLYRTPQATVVFWPDMSLSNHSGQTFLLSPIVASLVRVRPVGFHFPEFSATCLMLELIGCRKLKLKTLQCSGKNETFWAKRSEVFASVESYDAAKTMGSTNVTDCMALCNGCDAVEFHMRTKTCAVYNTSSVVNFRRVIETPHSSTYQKLCLHDPVAVAPVTVKTFFSRTLDATFPTELLTEMDGAGILTSLGYPLGYDTGIMTKWKIRFESSFVWFFSQLIFTNISLNVYQFREKTPCEDRIALIKGHLTTSSHGVVNGYIDHQYATALLVNSTMNGKQIIYPAKDLEMEIRFYSCLEESNITFRGNGFRATIKAVDFASFETFYRPYECPFLPVFQKTSNIVSKSFFGHDEAWQHFEYFSVCFQHTKSPIGLTILYMDVKCGEFSALEISDNNIFEHRFCNLNRPLESIVSIRGKLWLRLYYEKGYRQRNIQGFRARLDRLLYAYKEDVHETDQTTVYRNKITDWHQGCFEVYRRCYGVYRNTYFYLEQNDTKAPVSAHAADSNCAALMGPNARLARVKTRHQMLLFVDHLMRPMATRKIAEDLGFLYWNSIFDYVYIGLVWDTDVKGNLLARWSDGNSVTFSAWAPDQPRIYNSSHSGNRCTRMSVYSSMTSETWETIDCDLIAAEYYICEKDMPTKSSHTGNLHQQLPNTTITISHVDRYRYFHCRSGELVSRLYLCDGVRDCLDGMDELHCEHRDAAATCLRSDYFQCSNGDCIPVSMACDFVPDCPDGFDESCVFPACPPHEFRCANHQCIPSDLVCNYRKDCWDGSDETQCEVCGNGTFVCTDHSCLPYGRKCDGFSDCPDSKDEQDCRPSSMESCAAWWHNGHRESGVFLVNATEVFCDFSLVALDAVVLTKYFNMQAEKNSHGQFEFTYENRGFLVNLMDTLDCNQSVIQTCEPPTDLIEEMEAQLELKGRTPCTCLRLLWTQNITYVKPCSDAEAKILDEQWLLDTARVLKRYTDRPLTVVEPIKPSIGNQWMKVEPIVCSEVVDKQEADKLLCMKGNVYSASIQCLYDIDSYGDVIGCRDLTHLQNCENFSCPEGFVKCPDSFCLSSSLLCDGEKQCPDGQDEINCWCGEGGKSIAIMYDAHAQLNVAAVTLAEQVYDQSKSIESSNVLLVKYSQTNTNQSESSSSGSVVTHVEYTKYLPREINPFSGKRIVSVQHETELIRMILSLWQPAPAALIILNNNRRSTRFTIADQMEFGRPLLESMDVYAVSFGREAAAYFDSHRSSFPTKTTFVNFKDERVVMPFPFGTEICPQLPKKWSPVCPGMYRCHASRQCVPITQVCDGVRQCPLGDDERLCGFHCPVSCSCNAFEVDCSHKQGSLLSLSDLSAKTKYLDLHGNEFRTSCPSGGYGLPFMIALNISGCSLTQIPAFCLGSMRNLRVLDLSFNKIRILRLADLSDKFLLISLILTGNKELAVLEPKAFRDLNSLKTLVIREGRIDTIVAKTFYNLNVTLLDLSGNRISTIDDNAFDGAIVNDLYITDNQIANFHSEMFKGVLALKSLNTDAYKFCCLRPTSVLAENCFPARNDFSSCENLIRDEALRYVMWSVGITAFIGNIATLSFRLKFDRKRLKLGYGLLVTNLVASDVLMTVYLMTIAAVDIAFRGRYIGIDEWWRGSAWCSLVAVLCMVSYQASALFRCLVIIDRILVIKYPFGDFRFTTRLAYLASGVTWVLTVTIATSPLLFPYLSNHQFYSRTGVCTALDFSRDLSLGLAYPIFVSFGFNILAFVMLVIGQVLVHRNNRGLLNMAKKTKTTRARDLKVARNILLIVLTDILCWLPVGITGMITFSGHVVTSDVLAWMVMFVVPLTSALNPFLYTVPAAVLGKMFTPSLREQSADSVYHKGFVGSIIKLWDNQHLGQKRELGYNGDVLSTYLHRATLTPKEALKTGLRVAQSIQQLHSLDLVCGDLTSADVSIKRGNGIVADANLKIAPRIMNRQSEKRQDMSGVGQIISDLLQNPRIND